MKKIKILNFNELFQFQNIVLMVIISGIFGCSYNETLYSNLTKYKNSLEFEYDSEIITEKKNVLISVNNVEFKKSAMIDSTYIVEQSLPIIYYDWEKYNCFIGKDLIIEDVPSFVHNNLLEMIKRSAIFLTDYPDSNINFNMNEYQLDITINELNVNGEFVFMGEQRHVAYPAVAECQLTMNLTHNGSLVYTREVVQKGFTEEIQKRKYHNLKRFNSSDLQEQYATNMVKALSTAIKNSISEVIHNINIYLQQNESDLITIKEISVQDIQQKLYEQKIKQFPSDFLIFNINESTTINGKLVSFDQNNFYVENEKTLYTIKRKSIISITDKNLKIVTENKLTQKDFQRINYNKYSEFKEIE